MKLNKLIEKAIDLSRHYTSGDIPLYINGREVDIELKDVGENGDYRIILDVTNKPEPLPEMRIIDEIEVIVSNWARLNDLLSQGILKQRGNTLFPSKDRWASRRSRQDLIQGVG